MRKGERPRVAFRTLGCKINQYDTNLMAALLKAEGMEVIPETAEADVIIVNTCTVTARTDYKGRQLIRKAVRENPSALMVVTGCYAEVRPGEIAEIPGVDYVLGNAEKGRIVSWVSACGKQAVPRVRSGRIGSVRIVEAGPKEVHSGTTRAFLKIQDGCDQACAYCIIPRARGRSRSLEPGKVVEKVRGLVERGFEEVILCGIHLGRYGLDLGSPSSLLELLEHLDEVPIPRIRLSSIEPNELNDDLIRLFSRSKRLCPHFHLPLQSGDEGILRAMGRPYAPEDFAGRVETIRRMTPGASIGVDVIAGFPGEDTCAFERTVAFLEDLPVSYFHVFPFSPREGTAAAKLPNRVPPEVIHERAEILRRLGRGKRLAFYRRFRGEEVEVLVETRREKGTRLLRGVTRNYIPVSFPGADELMGRRVRVRISEVQERKVLGRAVGHEGYEPERRGGPSP